MKIKKNYRNIRTFSIATYSSDKDQNFSDCLFTLTGRQVLIKAAGINAKKLEFILLTAKEILHKEKLVSDGLRFSFLQLDAPLEDWSKIQKNHYILKQFTLQNTRPSKWAHLSLPVEKNSLGVDSSPLMKKTAQNLVSRFNSEGWIVYCRWLAVEIKNCLLTFKPDALDEYRLQARLEDYLHEIESPLLHAIEKNVNDAIYQQELLSVKEDYDQFFTLEKIIVAGQGKIRLHLEILWRLLGAISDEIDKIEKAHPELHSLKVTSYLLHIVLDYQVNYDSVIDWSQLILLLQLLNQQIYIISVFDSVVPEPTNFAFAVALAVAELSQKLPIEMMIKLCKTWTENNLQNPLNELIIANSNALNLNKI